MELKNEHVRYAGKFGRKAWQKFPALGQARAAWAKRGLVGHHGGPVEPYVDPNPKPKRDRQGKKAIKFARRLAKEAQAQNDAQVAEAA